MAGGVINPGDAVWAIGYLFGTIAGGTTDDVPFGEIQDMQLKDTIGLQEAMGSSSLGAVAVGVKDRKVTGSSKYLKIRARQFKLARGGTVAFATSITTYSAGINDEPLTFNQHYKAPSDGSTAELKLFGCVAPDLSLPIGNRDWVIPDLTFNVYGNGVNFYQVLLPGDMTTS